MAHDKKSKSSNNKKGKRERISTETASDRQHDLEGIGGG